MTAQTGVSEPNTSWMPLASQTSASGRTEAVGVDVVDVGGRDVGLFEGGADGAGEALAGAAAIEGGAEADDLAVDRRAAFLGVFEVLDDQDAGAFAEDDAVAVACRTAGTPSSGASLRFERWSNRHWRTMLSGLILLSVPPTRKKSAWSRRRMRTASPRASRRGDVAFGDRVVRPLGVVQDRDVAGEHVGQVLEHPQAAWMAGMPCSPHVGDRRSPAGSCALTSGGRGEFVQLRGDQAGAELDAEAGRVELRLVDLAVDRGRAGRRRRRAGWCGPSREGSCVPSCRG